MKPVAWQKSVLGSLGLSLLLGVSPTQAQITPDATVGTEVRQNATTWKIEGGTRAGGNLFHSFAEFSLPTDNTAFFNNASNITNIISRVTGGSLSSIDGLLKANGTANLILINPSGIRFGANARLDIGGSFLGTTASSIEFTDGTEYSAIAPQAQPLLTVSVPLGLQFNNPGAISVEGSGHNLTLETFIFSPFTRGSIRGLQVKEGQTLALVGGDLRLEGGTLTAEGGRIELGSVSEGLVNISANPQGWSFSYENVPSFRDIELRSQALADASGIGRGSINLQGRRISIGEGSAVLIQTQGTQSGEILNVNASEAVELFGTTPNGAIASGLFTEAIAGGKSGDIAISTQKLVVREGAVVAADTFSPAPGGDITVEASESVEIIGFSAINPNRFSIITAQTFGAGDAGDLTVATKRLTALDGGNIASVTGGILGTGAGGDVKIDATESIELIGVTPVILTPSQITAGTGSAGDAGNVTINTQKLIARDGGRVDASTLASGNAGSVTINASELVEVSGTVSGSVNPSLIISSGNIVDPSLREVLGLPPFPSGASGDVTINTSQLRIIDGGQITARNDGTGDAGKVEVIADSIFLDNEGGITALTAEGNAGNITLQAQDSLQLEGESKISTEASSVGNSGAINIFTGSFSLNENSDIESAKPEEGVGNAGNINISANSVLVQNDSDLTTDNRGRGDAGDININATADVIFNNEGDANSRVRGGVGNAGNININANSLIVSNDSELESDNRDGVGNGGNINITARSVSVNNGSDLRASTESQGNSGNINITASDTVIFDNNGDAESPVREGGVGNGGNINIITRSLLVTNGGNIRTSTFGKGNAGNINITASDTVSFDGFGINSDGELTFSAALSEVDAEAIGNGGNVTIETDSLSITNGAELSVFAEGEGNAGNLEIVAGSISLDNQGSISARTISEQGGNINLQLEDSLQLRRNSQISAAAASIGDGGNITIDTDTVTLLEDSRIAANAIEGRGGNIQINIQGLFLCAECQITASSNLGVDGNVDIVDPNIASLEVVELPSQLANSQEVVAIACVADRNKNRSEFSIIGRGGLPLRPTDPLNSPQILSFELSSTSRKDNSSTTAIVEKQDSNKLPPPAQGWYINSQGIVVLSAEAPFSSHAYSSGATFPNCDNQ
jgi:filamentous hemagglutinin family protein